MHIHIDAIGGIAGDMFVAAMLDAFPEYETPLMDVLSSLQLLGNTQVSLMAGQDKGLSGKRFVVKIGNATLDSTHFVFSPQPPSLIHQKHHATHQHKKWRDIESFLENAPVAPDVTRHALAIYRLLAQAESKIHGIPLNHIELHEVGAKDALIDIISAAFLINASSAQSWSVSDLPWGGGTVRCEHGEIPVPAPATLALLHGFNWIDDGEKGERVTPTGAAILATLRPQPHALSGTVQRVGYGFGQRKLLKRANTVRVTCFDRPANSQQEQQVMVVQCDIDDMTPELLAIAVNVLRERPAVIDITSSMLQGKKNRWVTRLEVLCNPDNINIVGQWLLNETSTLGIRFWPAQRQILAREHGSVTAEGKEWPVKYALRPDGSRSCKVEADALSQDIQGHHHRQGLKNQIEFPNK